MTATIDLNADLGEGDSQDVELLGVVSSCNIACGGHAGDAQSMEATVREALANGVAVGAHPSYPDREGFGRRRHFLCGEKLFASLRDQLHAIHRIAGVLGTSITHVKPHGALYNDAGGDIELAQTVIRAMKTLPYRPMLVGPPNSALELAAESQGFAFVAEAFIDRAYRPDGRLVSRSEPGAVHSDLAVITRQAVSLALTGDVETQDGEMITLRADTLCIHSDTPGAAEAARAVRQALGDEGVEIRAVAP
ncbi:MAG: 5-oxoprolinase subunit PxpA [Woeseiaceae bacterium]